MSSSLVVYTHKINFHKTRAELTANSIVTVAQVRRGGSFILVKMDESRFHAKAPTCLQGLATGCLTPRNDAKAWLKVFQDPWQPQIQGPNAMNELEPE